MKKKKANAWFPYGLGGLLILTGFGLILFSAMSGRLASETALPLPVGATTVAIGGFLLSRSHIAVFFYFLYTLVGLILTLREKGMNHPLPWLFATLLLATHPLARQAKN